MRILLFILAGMLVIIWAIGFFLLNAGNAIHILAITSAIAVMRGFIRDEEPVYTKKNPTWKVQD